MRDITYRNLDACKAFEALRSAARSAALQSLLTAERIAAYELSVGGGLRYNYAAKWVDDRTLALLAELAKEQQLAEKYRALAGGEVMNTGEERMVLHHLLRGRLGEPVLFDGKDLGTFYGEQQARIRRFA